MSSRQFRNFLAASVIVALAAAASSAASAAPMINARHAADLQASPEHALVQKVYWVWRHHHRVWVSPHRRY